MSVSQEEIIAQIQQRDSFHAQKVASQAKIIKIDEKLERLEQAKNKVNQLQMTLSQLRKNIYQQRDKTEWLGTTKNKFMNNMEKLNDNYNHYINEVDYYYNDICDAITRLENEKNNEQSMIAYLFNAINNISNWLEKKVH